MLSQMQGLRAAYDQATEGGSGSAPSAKQSDGESSKYKSQLGQLEKQVTELQVRVPLSVHCKYDNQWGRVRAVLLSNHSLEAILHQ